MIAMELMNCNDEIILVFCDVSMQLKYLSYTMSYSSICLKVLRTTEMYEFLTYNKFYGKRTKREKKTDVLRASQIHHKINAFHCASEHKIYRYVTDSCVR
jgi:hypothetical protein